MNEEILKERADRYAQLNKLLDPLEQIYKDMKQQMSDRERKSSSFSGTMVEERADNFMQTEIFAFSKQSADLYESYGNPTVVNAEQRKMVLIGTD